MKTKLPVFLFFMASLAAFGNGMGTYAISSAVRLSDPILREIKDITLLSEKLFINLNSGYGEVTVKYVLWNHSDNDYIDIDYAFPVDFISGEENEESWRWNKPGLKRIAFFCNDEPLAFTHSEDKKIDNPELPYKESLNSFVSSNSLCRRWYYTKFSLKKHSVAYLEVTYSLSNLLLCDGDSPLNISYMDMCEDRNLIYDFSPAACWGDGIIRDFYVEVNGRDLLFPGDRFAECSVYSGNGSYNGEEQWFVKGLDFERQHDRFVYRARNFDLKKAQPLHIRYSASEIPSLEILARHLLSPQQYSVKTSSEQKAYPASNLSDMNLETAWVGKGADDWIEFLLDADSPPLAGVLFVNGYQKSADTYTQNNRVKTLRIELRGEELETGWDIALEDTPYEPIFLENLFRHGTYYDFFDAYNVYITFQYG